MKKTKSTLILMAGLVFLLFCSSCVPILSTTTELRLENNEIWSMKVIIVLSGQDPYTKTGIEQALQQEISTAQQQGIQASWQPVKDPNNSSNLAYEIKLSGSGYAGLNSMVFNDDQAVTKGISPDQIVLNMSPYASFLGNGKQNTFTLIAGKIISANGNIKNRTTVTWVNSTSKMSALVSTTPDNTLAIIIIIITLVLLLVIGIVIAVARRRSARKPAYSHNPSVGLAPSEVQYCMNCGRQVPPGSEFCPFCGQSTH